MKERPILFSGPMVRALLDDRKTQTRRVVKVQADSIEPHDGYPGEWSPWKDGERQASILCPYGVPGDRLWVRETGWQPKDPSDRELREGADTWPKYEYDADGLTHVDHEQLKEWGWKRRPSIFMARRASRITLEITDVRVERLQEVSELDARAEGIRSDILPANDHSPTCICWVAEPDDNHAYVTAREAYAKTWDNINGAGSWDANPWIWAITFRRVQ